MIGKKKKFKTREEAVRELSKLRGWPARKVLYDRVEKGEEADLLGMAFFVEAEPGRYLLEGGGIG